RGGSKQERTCATARVEVITREVKDDQRQTERINRQFQRVGEIDRLKSRARKREARDGCPGDFKLRRREGEPQALARLSALGPRPRYHKNNSEGDDAAIERHERSIHREAQVKRGDRRGDKPKD